MFNKKLISSIRNKIPYSIRRKQHNFLKGQKIFFHRSFTKEEICMAKKKKKSPKKTLKIIRGMQIKSP